MLVTESGALSVGLLFVFFVMAMVRIEKVADFADFVLEMDGINFGIM